MAAAWGLKVRQQGVFFWRMGKRATPHQLQGLGECCKLSSRVRGIQLNLTPFSLNTASHSMLFYVHQTNWSYNSCNHDYDSFIQSRYCSIITKPSLTCVYTITNIATQHFSTNTHMQHYSLLIFSLVVTKASSSILLQKVATLCYCISCVFNKCNIKNRHNCTLLSKCS